MPRAQHDSGDPSEARDLASDDRIDDDRDRDADRVGDLPSDLSGDLASDPGDLQIVVEADDEVWFEPEALAAASQIELGLVGDRSSVESSLLEQLRTRMASPGIALEQLPSWPRGQGRDPDAGPTLGSALAELLGELRPGEVILVGGRGRGVGRTNLLSQLADALALRTDAPESSVLCLVEGPPVYWRARSLGRWSGIDARHFLASGGSDVAAQLERFEAGEWRNLDARQRFIDTSRAEWTDKIEHSPVVVIDPIEQLVGPGETLDERLATLERLAHERGLIVLASCDEPEPADARRIDRHVQARLRVSGSGKNLDIELCHCRLGPSKSVRLRWDRASGRIGG